MGTWSSEDYTRSKERVIETLTASIGGATGVTTVALLLLLHFFYNVRISPKIAYSLIFVLPVLAALHFLLKKSFYNSLKEGREKRGFNYHYHSYLICRAIFFFLIPITLFSIEFIPSHQLLYFIWFVILLGVFLDSFLLFLILYKGRKER